MTTTAIEAIYHAQEAFRRGDKHAARQWAEQAVALDPNQEDAWLLLAAVSSPRASVLCLQRALEIHPGSERAQKGMEWALKRVLETESRHETVVATQPVRLAASTQPVKTGHLPAVTQPLGAAQPALKREAARDRFGLPAILTTMACLLIAITVFISATPAKAFLNSLIEAPQGSVSWAAAQVPKSFPSPTLLPSALATSVTDADFATQGPVFTQAAEATRTATPVPTEPVALELSPTPMPTDMVIEASPTPLPTDTPPPGQPAPNYDSGKLILVDISEQHLYAYENGALVFSFVASTGMRGGTRVGTFSVLDKIPNAYGSTWDIWMPNWLGIYWSGSLENGIHALPILPNGQRLWAGYLGTPISYGCVVLGTYESELLYNWAEIGTVVEIQY